MVLALLLPFFLSLWWQVLIFLAEFDFTHTFDCCVYSTNLYTFPLAATSDYRQSLQFQNLNDEKRNIRLEVRASMIMQLIDGTFFDGLIFKSALCICPGYPQWEKSWDFNLWHCGRRCHTSQYWWSGKLHEFVYAVFLSSFPNFSKDIIYVWSANNFRRYLLMEF